MKDATPVHRDTAHVLWAALEMSRLSAGAFDVTAAPLVSLWKVTADDPGIPSAEAISRARDLVDYRCLEVFRSAATPLRGPVYAARLKRPGQMVDLGGIAKGYAVDRMAEVLQHHGVAQALAALDGELRAIGGQADGRPWAVAIESPQTGLRRAHGVLALQDLAVATSGDYRHFFDVNGQRLAHSMDARSGTPVRGDVASVTVLAANCMLADAWATALLVAGAAQGLALAQRHGLEALWLLRRGGALVELGLGRFDGA